MYGYYGGPAVSLETQTEKGIRGLSTALIICLVAAVLSMIASLAAVALLGQISGGATLGIAASAIGLLGLLCGAFALYLVVIILGLIGFSAAHKGKTEFGPAHEGDMTRALYMLVVAIIFFFASIVISAMLGFTVGLTSGTSDLSILESPAFMAMTEIFSILFSLAVALILYYIVKVFLPPERHNIAIAAIILYTLSPVFSYILDLAFGLSPGSLVSTATGAFNPVWLIPGLVSGLLSLIALLLFLVLYRDVVSRLKSRQFKPQWDTMAGAPPFQPQEIRWQPPPSP